jgi:aspartyl/asparaginyl beta-hydroxylase (cupin superfamily)
MTVTSPLSSSLAASRGASGLIEAEEAVHARRWTEARRRLEDLTVADARDAAAFGLLATACYQLGDAAAATLACDKALALDPREIRAVLTKADLLWSQGERRGANLYYSAVIQHAAERQGDLTSDLAEGLTRARAIRERLAANMLNELQTELDRAGYAGGTSDPRFTHALDLLTGKRQLYTPQPRAFFYPDLPNWQFYPRATLPWADAVEAATDAITQELTALLTDDVGFAPYLNSHPNLPNQPDYPLIDSLDWSSCFLWKDGAETPNAALCPRTMDALKDVPLCLINARSPQVMFSQLKAGAHIKPHTGYVNTRLTCHLPLIVPPNCSFRVGNELRSWEKGKLWAFDDTIEHEAINQSDRTRVVLIFDIWRPELSPEERHLVATLLETLDAFSPRTQSWE